MNHFVFGSYKADQFLYRYCVVTTVFLVLIFSNASVVVTGLRKLYNYKKLDKHKFCSLLRRQNWEDILEARSIDESARLFTKIFMDSTQECMLVKTGRALTNDALWMTNEIRSLIKQRGKMYRKTKQSNLKAHWDNFHFFIFFFLILFFIPRLGSVT